MLVAMTRTDWTIIGVLASVRKVYCQRLILRNTPFRYRGRHRSRDESQGKCIQYALFIYFLQDHAKCLGDSQQMSLIATLCVPIVSNSLWYPPWLHSSHTKTAQRPWLCNACRVAPRCMCFGLELCLWRCFCTCSRGFTGHTWNKTSPSRRNSSQGDVVLYHFGLLGSLVLSCLVESLYTYLIFRDDHILECSWLESCSKVSQYPHLRLVAILSSYLKRGTLLCILSYASLYETGRINHLGVELFNSKLCYISVFFYNHSRTFTPSLTTTCHCLKVIGIQFPQYLTKSGRSPFLGGLPYMSSAYAL